MFKSVLEEEFLNRKNQLINHIGIYELDWIIDDNQLDCEGIIVSFEDKQYLIKSFVRGNDDFEFLYYEFTKEYKDIDVVVNSAGFGKMGYINEIDVADDIDMINTNITALHLITKHFSMVMDKGNIINVSSIAGVTPTPYMSQYGATKAYVYSPTRSLYISSLPIARSLVSSRKAILSNRSIDIATSTAIAPY